MSEVSVTVEQPAVAVELAAQPVLEVAVAEPAPVAVTVALFSAAVPWTGAPEQFAVTLEPQPHITIQVESVGIAPAPDDLMPPSFATRTDFVSATTAYVGEALPGTGEALDEWRIKRLTFGADDDVTTEWADGNANFDNVWADRATLAYS